MFWLNLQIGGAKNLMLWTPVELLRLQISFLNSFREQVLSIISSFDALIVVMDGRVGLVPEDRDLVRIAKESGRPFVIVVNKIDQAHKKELMLSEFL